MNRSRQGDLPDEISKGGIGECSLRLGLPQVERLFAGGDSGFGAAQMTFDNYCPNTVMLCSDKFNSAGGNVALGGEWQTLWSRKVHSCLMNKKNLFQGGDAVLMQIIFIGVGEACDTEYPNTSLLVELNNGGGVCHILLDCGFTTPHGYFKSCGGPDQLAALWVSHFHGDHFFGAPLLLLRLWEMGRKSPLVILGQEGIREKISQAMELAYPGFLGKLEYPLEFVVVEPGGVVEAAGVRWQVAENVHSQRALAVRVDHDRKALFYSGDGRPTDATLELARGCGLVVHEAFQVDREMQGHGSVRECLEFAEKSGVNNLALVHMQRGQRNLSRDAIQEMLRLSGRHVFLPEPGDVFVL